MPELIGDIDNMTRIVNQLLDVAEADTLTIDNLLNYGSPASPVQVSSSAAGAFYSVAATSSVGTAARWA